MNKTDVAKLLTIASAVDNRRITEAAVNVWHDLIGHLDAEVAFEALRSFRRTQPGVYLEPGHILAEIRKAKDAQGVSYHPAPPPGKRYAVDVMNDYRELQQ